MTKFREMSFVFYKMRRGYIIFYIFLGFYFIRYIIKYILFDFYDFVSEIEIVFKVRMIWKDVI